MTSIYNTGTVSVTNGNAVVTGSGTAWAVALVTGGMFSSVGMAVPIASVESDTSLTLAYDWPGTTASGTDYAIALENAAAASVVDLNTTLSRVLVTLSLAGITPDLSGTLTERDALTLAVGDKGFLFLHAEIGVAFAFYRWTGTAWDGPFAVANAVATGGVSSIVGSGITVDNTNPAIPALSIPNDSILNSKLNNMANATVKGRATAGTGDPEDLTMAQFKALLLSGTVIREVLTANRTYYVRKDGSDANNGLADTAGGAFLTIQKAVDIASALDLSIYTVTINVRVGTYTENVSLKTYIGGSGNGISIIGDTATPANILINGTSVCFNAPGVLGVYTLQGMKLQSTGSHGIQASNGSIINYGQIDFGALTGTSSHIVCFGGAIVNCVANYTISGGAFRHWWVESGAFLQAAGRTITLTGTPAFSSMFAYSNMSAIIQCNADTFTGAATGPRYSASVNGVISTGGGGATYLPGNAASGAPTGTGGQYV